MRLLKPLFVALAFPFLAMGAETVIELLPDLAREGMPVNIVLNRLDIDRVELAYRTTTNGTAVPGVDFLPVSGSIVLLLESSRSFSITNLLDNGALDLPKTIQFEFDSLTPGVALADRFVTVHIFDNEISPALDFDFTPDFRASAVSGYAVQPDHRIIVHGSFPISGRLTTLARLCPTEPSTPLFGLRSTAIATPFLDPFMLSEVLVIPNWPSI